MCPPPLEKQGPDRTPPLSPLRVRDRPHPDPSLARRAEPSTQQAVDSGAQRLGSNPRSAKHWPGDLEQVTQSLGPLLPHQSNQRW